MCYWLTICAANAISVIEEQLIDHGLLFDCQLRAHDILLHLLAELLESPGVVELYFKFDLLGRGILRVSIGVLVGRV